MKNYKQGSTTIIPIILVLIVVVAFIVLLSQNLNNMKEKAKNITMEKVSLTYSSGLTKLTTKVTNNKDEVVNEVKFKVRFLDENKLVIGEANGRIETLNPHETKNVDITIMTNVENTKEVVYIII
jgi:uncharacterized protein YcfL